MYVLIVHLLTYVLQGTTVYEVGSTVSEDKMPGHNMNDEIIVIV